MDEETANANEVAPVSPPKPVIPPPDLSRPPPPPPSPLDSLPRAAPPIGAMGNAAAKVSLHVASDEEELLASGLAPFNARITAAALDIVVAMGITTGLMFILPGFADRLAWLTGLAYLITRDSLPFLGGQSVGKKAMKLRAVTQDGQSLVSNWQAALIRNGVLIIPFFGLVELFILLTREDKPERGRRLGDEWAKTQVILEPKPPVAEDAG